MQGKYQITTQPNQSCGIADHFYIRFRRKNDHRKPCNKNFLQLNFSLTDISNYIPTNFAWKFSGYWISEQSFIF